MNNANIFKKKLASSIQEVNDRGNKGTTITK